MKYGAHYLPVHSNVGSVLFVGMPIFDEYSCDLKVVEKNNIKSNYHSIVSKDEILNRYHFQRIV